MRILVAHNSYLVAGGEDTVVTREVELLRSRGHDVEIYRRSNVEIADRSMISAGFDALWSRQTAREIEKIIDVYQPDLIHAHNIFPRITPTLYRIAKAKRVPVVQTLHNFRILCVNGLLMRHGSACHRCVETHPWRGALMKCYKDSIAASTVAAASLSLHRLSGSFDMVSRYVALSQCGRDLFTKSGIPARKISVKPNFIADPSISTSEERHGFIFAGRLVPEKGVESFLAAAAGLDSPIRVAGEGALSELVSRHPTAQSLGVLKEDALLMEMARSEAVVVPSIWPEPFGLVAVEALAVGTPVIASRIGALPEIIEDQVTGLLFEPGNAADLGAKLKWATENPESMRRMGRAARQRYLANYSPSENYKQLINIYTEAIAAA